MGGSGRRLRRSPRTSSSRGVFVALLLSPLGVLFAHLVGYSIGGSGTDHAHQSGVEVGHSHLQSIWAFAGLLGVTALISTVVKALHRRGVRQVHLPALLVAQTVGFVALEVGERFLQGIDPFALDIRVWIGLALQPIVAFLIARLFEDVAQRIAAVLDRFASSERVCPACIAPTSVTRLAPSAGHPDDAPTRGPPVLV